MTPHDAELLMIYLTIAPLLVVGVALFVYRFTVRTDQREREQKRHQAEKAP